MSPRTAQVRGKLSPLASFQGSAFTKMKSTDTMSTGSTFAIMGGKEASWWVACLSDQPSTVSTPRKIAR